MLLGPLLLDPLVCRCEHLAISPGHIVVELKLVSIVAICPTCGQCSSRLHSRYVRTVADLPWCGTPVQIRWEVRRFFCDRPDCPRCTFAEQLPGVAGFHARKTRRLTQSLCGLGFRCGGEGGSRLAAVLGMPASADTILDLVRRAPAPTAYAPRVLGVDDWAWHKGQRYGTILIDLEEHRPVDLLPDRSADSFAAWLIAHPGVQIISRDRGGCYARGAKIGAPDAVQVADRFHLACNLREAMKRAVDRCVREVLEASRVAAAAVRPESAATEPQAIEPPLAAEHHVDDASPASAFPNRADVEGQASRERRMRRYTEVIELHRQGLSMREIVRRVGLDRQTVGNFVHAGQFPERAVAKRHYIKEIDPFVDHLRQRWEQGCHNAVELARELAPMGFTGSYHMVRRLVADWRNDGSSDADAATRKRPRVRRLSSNEVSWLLLQEPADASEQEKAFLEALYPLRPELKVGAELAKEFVGMLRGRKAEALDGWMEQAHGAEMPQELAGFADGVKQDYEAVKAALTLEWSNGQVEGQVNRLKLIKRHMYGRANFDLLRQRVLNVA